MKVIDKYSTDKNVSKHIFYFTEAIAEAVLYKFPDYETRTVICCSVMSGCPVGCVFCGTGKNFTRNLTSKEIEHQVAFCLEKTGVIPTSIKRLQIMFMSMGEPFLNFENTAESIRNMHRKYPNAALLISTAAPTNHHWLDFFALSKSISRVGLQFSIHDSTNEARNLTIPFLKKDNLETIAYIGDRWHRKTGRNPFINYCVTEKNNTDADADRLSKLFNPQVFKATISVVCEKNETIKRAAERQSEMAGEFSRKLSARGFCVRTFNPAGQDDIGGGCGQLWETQKWFDARKK